MQITSSGNVGIGVVPSSWNTSTSSVQLKHYGALSTDEDGNHYGTNLSQNAYSEGGGIEPSTWKYITSNVAARPSIYQQYNGGHYFSTAATGTADAAISWTTAMTINAAGSVGIGTSSPSGKLTSESAASSNIVAKSTNGNGGYYNYQGLASDGTQTFGVNHNGTIFTTSGLALGGTGAANTLDDYETGTFSPTVAGSSGLSTLTGYYVKIGNIVHVAYYSSSYTATAVGATVGNLPFTAATNGSVHYPFITSHNNWTPNSNGGYIGPNTNYARLIADGTLNTAIGVAGYPKYVMINATYAVA